MAEETLKAEVVPPTGNTPAVTTTAADTGAAGAHVCTNGKDTRRIELTAGKPCSVHYKKETEQPGHDQVLWSANNDPKFCETKASAFVEKLSGLGWKCNKG